MSAANPALTMPYPGLRSFRREESDLFFGREDFVGTMVDKLGTTRFLAVLGSSGTGKSSVVKTGLLDSLDPESSYLSPLEYTDYKDKTANSAVVSAHVTHGAPRHSRTRHGGTRLRALGNPAARG